MLNNNLSSNKPQRLNKFVALCLGMSRRQADELIEQGKIIVNNQPAKLGQQITNDDKITYHNKPLSIKDYQLILLNKPVGYVCSRASQGSTPTIYKLLPKAFAHLKPVGRLDKDSSGLILLTNNGDLAHRLTHPSFHKIKRYLVTINLPLQPLHRQMISDFGVQLADGHSKFELTRQHEGDDRRWIVTMSEGRNRQIRRTFTALGYTVTKLHRTNFGNYSLDDLKRGEWREITDIKKPL